MCRKTSQWLMIVITFMGLSACTKSLKNESSGESEPPQMESKRSIDGGMPDYKRAALINVELGLGYLSQGQVARAKTKLTHALKLAPGIPETHTAMAYFLEMVGEYKDSEKEHKKSVKISSGKGAVYNNYGAFLCRRDRFKEADVAFNSAIADKEYARTAEVYENAGLCALKSQSKEVAAEYLTTAIRQDPSRSIALLELAALDLSQGKTQEAKDLLGRFRSLSEPNPRSLWLGIQVAKALNDDKSATTQALMLKNLFRDSQEYQMYVNSEKNSS